MCEDNEDDVLLVDRALRVGEIHHMVQVVEAADPFTHALATKTFDVVISDYSMPSFTALDALRIVQASSQPDLPFVIVSGSVGEEAAVSALKAGAHDFVVKTNLSRLAPAVHRELREAAMRRERRDALEALRVSLRARDEFLSIASHELKTPLTSLQLNTESLLRSFAKPDPVTAEHVVPRLKRIARQAHRLTELINGLLDVSRITEGRIPLVRTRLDLCELAREILERGDFELSRVKLHAPAPVVGAWDRSRMDTILTNLLSNAMKYGGQQPIDLTIKSNGTKALLAVEDYGIGIAEADQARIFERFERAVPSKHYGGFGIGLWVTRQIVEEHGGRIVVTSAPGRGSRFDVELPTEIP
jgi:signal transduction histidine kinase